MAYDYLMNRTKLGYILMVSDVNIESDEEYMEKKHEMDKRIKSWHVKNKGNDNYLTYRLNLALSYFSKDEIIESIDHLKSKGRISRYEEIMNLLKG